MIWFVCYMFYKIVILTTTSNKLPNILKVYNIIPILLNKRRKVLNFTKLRDKGRFFKDNL